MTLLIEQRTPDQCAIATIAMATGIDYDTVLEAAGVDYVAGKGTSNLSEILVRLGLNNDWKDGFPNHTSDFQAYYLDYTLKPEYFRRQLWGRRAMVQTPSLNVKDGMHLVYWTGREVLDPNPPTKKRYASFKELMPEYIWVFNEIK